VNTQAADDDAARLARYHCGMRRCLLALAVAASGCTERPSPPTITLRPQLRAPPHALYTGAPVARRVEASVPTVSIRRSDGEICAVKAAKIVCTKVPVDLPEPMRGVVLTHHSSCGLAVSGNLWCWGSNEHGYSGLGRFDHGHQRALEPPARIPLPGPAVDLALALTSSTGCVVTADGALHCWFVEFGSEKGIFGDGRVLARDGPARVPTPSPVREVADCSGAPCGVLRDGSLFVVDARRNHHPVLATPYIPILGTRGFDNAFYAVGGREPDQWVVCGVRAGRIECVSTPTNAESERSIARLGFDRFAGVTAFSIDLVSEPMCAITAEGDVQCWVERGTGRVPGLRKVKSLEVGGHLVCAQQEDEEVRCFDAIDIRHFKAVYDPFAPAAPR